MWKLYIALREYTRKESLEKTKESLYRLKVFMDEYSKEK